MYMCVYNIYIFTHIHIHIYIYVHTHTQTYFQNRKRLTDKENQLTVTKGEMRSLGLRHTPAVRERDRQQGPAARPRERYSMFPGNR